MKKIFFINCADFGSTGKIIRDTATVLKTKGWQTVLCVPKQTQDNALFDKVYAVSMKYEQGLYYRLGKITGNKYGIAPISTSKIINAIKTEQPTLVHVHCANGCFVNLYKLFDYLKHSHIPTVVTNHAEFYYTGYCDHAYYCEKWKTGCDKCEQKNAMIDGTAIAWERMRKAFKGFENLVVTSVSPWVYSRSTQSPILEGVRQVVVENGLNTDIFKNYHGSTNLENFNIPQNAKIILHVTAHFYGDSEKKGSKYILDLARRFLDDNVVVLVVGNHDDVNVPQNMRLLGRVTNQVDLAKLYSMADLSVVTGERETFSMPVAESLCCGTPVVGFKAGGPESIAIEEFSEFFDYGNAELMEDRIRDKWLSFKENASSEIISEIAMSKYSKESMAAKYIKVYEDLIECIGV